MLTFLILRPCLLDVLSILLIAGLRWSRCGLANLPSISIKSFTSRELDLDAVFCPVMPALCVGIFDFALGLVGFQLNLDGPWLVRITVV